MYTHIFAAVKEGIALMENGLSPYSGDIFHEVSIELCVFISFLSIVGLAHGEADRQSPHPDLYKTTPTIGLYTFISKLTSKINESVS